MNVSPKSIKLAGERDTVSVHWSDGHVSAYPYAYLRGKCPCATCEELGAQAMRPPSQLPILGQRPLKPERAELVGRYALQIYWSDGHSSGIYAFDYLRSLCPCPECTAKRESASVSE